MADITPEVLKESLKRGVGGVRDALSKDEPEGQGQQAKTIERNQQVQRASRALDVLRSDSLNVPERKAVIEASRQIIQDALTSTTAELQKNSGEKLQHLKSEQERYLAAKERVLDMEKKLSGGLPDRVITEAREFGIDVRDASTEKKVGYAIAGVAGFALVHKIWSATTGLIWGEKAKPGVLRRVITFLAGLGGAVAGAIGLNALLKTKIGSEAAEFAGDVPKSLNKGLHESPLLKDTIPAIKETVINGAVSEVKEKRKKGEIIRDDEYYMKLALAYLKDGYVIIGAGADHLWKSGEMLTLEKLPQLKNALKNIINDPHEIWKAHLEGVAIYGASFGIIQTTMLAVRDGLVPGVIGGLKQTALWEVSLLKPGGSALLGRFTHDGRMIQNATYAEWKYTLPYRQNRIAHYFGMRSKNLETLADLVEEYRQYNNFINELKDVKKANDIVERFQLRTRAIRANIQSSLFGMRDAIKNTDEVSDASKQIEQIFGKKIANQFRYAKKVGDIDIELLKEELPAALRNMDAADTVAKTTTGSNAAAKAAEYRKAATGTVDAGADSLKVAKGVGKEAEAVEEVSKGFMRAKAEILAARATKSGAAVLEALQKYATVLRAAAQGGNRMAKALLAVFSLTRSGGKWAMKGLPIVCTLIDAAMLLSNYFEIQKAIESGNLGMQQTLESKQQMLRIQAELGIGLFALGPQGLLILPSVIIGGYLANSIYDSVVTWDKTAHDWMKESPEELDKKLQELPIGYVDAGHKYGIMTHPLKRPFMSQEDREKEGRDIEKVNINVRQEILTAYFLKTMRVRSEPNETEVQKKDRIAGMVRQRLQYIGKITNGTYVRSDAGAEYYYGDAGRYAEMNTMRSSLQEQGKPELLTYLWDGQEKSIDLRTLNYMRNPKATEQERMAFLKTMNAYRNEYSQIQEAVQDYQQEFNATDLALATPESATPKVAQENAQKKGGERIIKQAV